MTTIRSSTLYGVDGHATVTVSPGAGNVDGVPEVHLLVRGIDDEQTYTVLGWFNADELLAAVADARENAPELRVQRILTEPAAA